jgi:HlyD family secretion protein
MSKKTVVALVALIAIVGVGWWAYRRKSTTSAATTAEVTMVRREPIQQTVSATGSLAPATEQVLSYADAGTVTEALVAVGDQVNAGDPLVKLDSASAERAVSAAQVALDAARTGLASAQASLDDLEAGPSADDIESAQLTLDSAKDRRWAAQSSRDATCGRLEGASDQSGCNSAQASVQQAEDSVRQAEMDLAKALKGPTDVDLAAARDKVAQAHSTLQSAQAKLDDAQQALADTTITAPDAGTVTTLDATPGSRVTAGQQAVTVSDLSSFQVEISLDETDVSKIKTGLTASVVADAFPDETMTGTVTAVAPVAQVQSGVVLYPVTVQVRPGASPVRAGMTVDVGVVTASKDSALVVPLRAVTAQGDNGFVTVLTQAPAEVAAFANGGGQGVRANGTFSRTFGSRAGASGGGFTRTTGQRNGGQGAAQGSAGPQSGAGASNGRSGAASAGRFTGTGSNTARFANQTLQIAASELTGMTQRVPVTLGLSTDSQVEILSGLDAGTWIVVSTGSEQPAFSSQNRGFFFGGGPPPGGGR